MSAPFQPGDVVVCVKRQTPPIGRARPVHDNRSKLRVGAYYTITHTFSVKGTPAVLLREIEPLPHLAGFPADRFRKIDDEVTADFRELMRSLSKPKITPMLNPTRHSRELVK